MIGFLLYFLMALAAQHAALLVLPAALLAAVAAYFALMNLAVLHAIGPLTSPLLRAVPGTHTALARQIVRLSIFLQMYRHSEGSWKARCLQTASHWRCAVWQHMASLH